MDGDENLHQETFAEAFEAVIAGLDRNDTSFSLQMKNLRDALVVTHLLSLEEKVHLAGLLRAKVLSSGR